MSNEVNPTLSTLILDATPTGIAVLSGDAAAILDALGLGETDPVTFARVEVPAGGQSAANANRVGLQGSATGIDFFAGTTGFRDASGNPVAAIGSAYGVSGIAVRAGARIGWASSSITHNNIQSLNTIMASPSAGEVGVYEADGTTLGTLKARTVEAGGALRFAESATPDRLWSIYTSNSGALMRINDHNNNKRLQATTIGTRHGIWPLSGSTGDGSGAMLMHDSSAATTRRGCIGFGVSNQNPDTFIYSHAANEVGVYQSDGTTPGTLQAGTLGFDGANSQRLNGNSWQSYESSLTTWQTGIQQEASASGVKLGFFEATVPVVQPTAIADADGSLADLTAKFNSLLAKARSLGLIST